MTLGCLLVAMFFQPSFAQADNYQRWLNVHNNSWQSICEVRITNVATSSWGNDLLGRSQCINSGYYVTVYPNNFRGYCKADIQVTYADGSVSEMYDFNICEVADVSF